jgi:hypothetical protein
MQSASAWHCPGVLHSLMSKQFTPSPANPATQVQVKEPAVSEQVALAEQSSVFKLHSSIFVQVVPFPS